MTVDKTVASYIKNNGLNGVFESVGPSPTLSRSAWVKGLIEKGLPIVNCTAGEPDLLPPGEIRKAGAEAIMNGDTGYTNSSGIPDVRKKVANTLNKREGTNYGSENVVLTNGLKEGLFLVTSALIEPANFYKGEPDEVILAIPFWGTYKDQVTLSYGKPVIAEKADDHSIKAKISERTKAVILNFPCNPDGSIIPEADLESIAGTCKERSIFLIADIMYKDILRPGVSVISPYKLEEKIPGISDYLVVGDGLSKGYGKLTGMRLGYIIAAEGLAGIIEVSKENISSNSNVPAQIMLSAALEIGPERMREFNSVYTERMNEIVPSINQVGEVHRFDGEPSVKAIAPPSTFYVTLDFSALRIRSTQFADYLTEKGFVATIPYGFGVDPMKGLQRASFATSEAELRRIPGNLDDFFKTYQEELKKISKGS